MTFAGGGVLTPSSGGVQVIRLCSRLVVGIRLHGTIAAVHPRNPNYMKCRPFLHYFGKTLRRLRCDVTLFAPTAYGMGMQQQSMPLSDHEFPCEYRVVDDPTSGVVGDDNGGTKRAVRHGMVRSNFQEYLSDVAADLKTSPARILFIDAEINYRFSPTQTVVLEVFEPKSIQQKRRRRQQQQEQPNDTVESSLRMQRHAAVLDAEFMWAQKRQELQLHDGPRVPLAAESYIGPHGGTGNIHAEDAVRAAALAINREDYTLVALAGMLLELSVADVSVADYLRVEPLVEKLTVPFHGSVNYLPVENCDDMEQWDWNRVEVQEATNPAAVEAAGIVPEVEEREEHRDMFK